MIYPRSDIIESNPVRHPFGATDAFLRGILARMRLSERHPMFAPLRAKRKRPYKFAKLKRDLCTGA